MSLGQWLSAKVGNLDREGGPAMVQAAMSQGGRSPGGISQGGMSQGDMAQPAMSQPPMSQSAMAQPARASLASSGQDIAEIHRRLDSITQQINQLSPGRPSAPAAVET